jgi:hypothetical protein
MGYTNRQNPLEKKVMATSKVVIYSTNLVLRLHNVFSNVGEILSSGKKYLHC